MHCEHDTRRVHLDCKTVMMSHLFLTHTMAVIVIVAVAVAVIMAVTVTCTCLRW